MKKGKISEDLGWQRPKGASNIFASVAGINWRLNWAHDLLVLKEYCQLRCSLKEQKQISLKDRLEL